MKLGFVYYLILFSFLNLKGQNISNQYFEGNGNVVSTAVPFLLFNPDARSNSLGGSGVSTEPDIFSSHWNSAKLSQIEGDYGIGLSYLPWLKSIDPNIYLTTINGFKRLDRRTCLGFGVYYFSLGQTIFKDESGNQNGVGYPNEFSLEATFSERFGRHFSLGVTGKYIHSDLTNGQIFLGKETSPGNTGAIDFSFYYNRIWELKNPIHLSLGLNLSNLGPKINYGLNNSSFLPSNLRFGVSIGKIFNDIHYTNFSLEFNKLLVPTLPIIDSKGNIISGQDPNVGAFKGILSSFTDAPGGLKEELQEISISPAFEYRFGEIISIRTGMLLVNKNFGNKKLLDFGLGLKIAKNLDLSFSYQANLVPLSSITNTFTLSLSAIL